MVHANPESALPRRQRSMIPVAMIAALSAAAVMLSGCGRKGSLDAPPGVAELEQEPAPVVDQSALFPNYDHQKRPLAPQGRKRPIFLDVLID